MGIGNRGNEIVLMFSSEPLLFIRSSDPISRILVKINRQPEAKSLFQAFQTVVTCGIITVPQIRQPTSIQRARNKCGIRGTASPFPNQDGLWLRRPQGKVNTGPSPSRASKRTHTQHSWRRQQLTETP